MDINGSRGAQLRIAAKRSASSTPRLVAGAGGRQFTTKPRNNPVTLG